MHASLLCEADQHCNFKFASRGANRTHQEDNRTPPGFAVVGHLRPHHVRPHYVPQCQSKALHAGAYQQPASEVQVNNCWQLSLQLWLRQQHSADPAITSAPHVSQHHGEAVHHAALSNAQLQIVVACQLIHKQGWLDQTPWHCVRH